MTALSDSLIPLRERLLSHLFNIPDQEVLNPHPINTSPPTAQELVRRLKQAVNGFKQSAMDSKGAQVNYQQLVHTGAFEHYQHELVPLLQSLNFEDLTDRNTALAFWINLYNALTIHAVIAYNVQKSITEQGFFGQVRFFRRAAYNIGGLRFSLEDIEHGVLRANRGNPFQFSPQFSPGDQRTTLVISPPDPRIHFALNCASVSCPPIGVYDHTNIDHQLDLAVANYIHQETKLLVGQLYISKLFLWYKKDFGSNTAIANFLTRYLPDGLRKNWLHAHRSKLSFKFLPYDWNLNIWS